MSGKDQKTELSEELRFLEDNYLSQPPIIREEDLEEINRLRGALGMRLVDAQLQEIGAPKKPAPQAAAAAEEAAVAVDKHLEARQIYQRYLAKKAELELHQAHADRIVKATEGRGMTPVLPLATMGTDGGPLLCDVCEKPIPLEGGGYHGVSAHVAWDRNPKRDASWKSWILGGLVIELETNGTIRIYHGYPNQRGACCGKATAESDRARAAFDFSARLQKKRVVAPFVKEELLPGGSDRDQRNMIHKILDLLYGFDPGYGINLP